MKINGLVQWPDLKLNGCIGEVQTDARVAVLVDKKCLAVCPNNLTVVEGGYTSQQRHDFGCAAELGASDVPRR